VVQQVLVQENLLEKAQQGDPNAIAALVNQVLTRRGITTTAKMKGTCLHVVLAGDKVPDRDFCVNFMEDGMSHLKPAAIYSVRLYGKRKDRKKPAWTQLLEFRQPVVVEAPVPVSEPIVAPPPQPRRPKKLKKKPRTRIPILVMGGTIWVTAAVLGAAIGSRLHNQNHQNSSDRQPAAISRAETQQSDRNSSSPVPTSPNPAIANTSITLKAVGDIVPGTNFPNNRLPANKRQLFQSIKPALQGADILFGNFESTMTTYRRPAKDTSRSMVFAFRNPPSYANLFKEVGFDVLSVANNHSFDFSPIGFEDTIRNIEAAGVRAVGKKDQILYTEVKGVKVAFIGFSHLNFHNSLNDLPAGKRLVEEAKENSDIVVISVHAGAEGSDATRVRNRTEMFYGENRGNKVRFARTMIDSGADLVLGHGPHVPRAIELYKGKLIAYSLGNFIGYRTLSTVGNLGESLVLEVKMNSQGDFESGKIIPVQLDRRGIPYPDRGRTSIGLIRRLNQLDFPNSPLRIDSNGKMTKVDDR
jgi:Bacterial capsule synthesis protein PGA_cap